ncbi:MAG: hypothetical protein JWM80_5014 [Cyanobacteria bacterium RYN_339]|nr:hypothetical protein [Cyanobacteria bacterium RYN_339]
MNPINNAYRLPVRPVRPRERDLGDGNLRRILPIGNPAQSPFTTPPALRRAVHTGSSLLEKIAGLFAKQGFRQPVAPVDTP